MGLGVIAAITKTFLVDARKMLKTVNVWHQPHFLEFLA